MADFEDLQQKEVVLDLDGIPKDLHSEIKEAVGEHIINSILDLTTEGVSPVSGERKWKQLTKKYAERFHDGDRTPRLELTGDMKAALGFKNTKDGIAVGIMESSQRPKADGHNNLSGESALPQRRFIPSTDQDFKSEIMNEVDNIIEQYRADAQAQAEAELEATGEGISTNIFSDETIAELLLRRLRQ